MWFGYQVQVQYLNGVILTNSISAGYKYPFGRLHRDSGSIHDHEKFVRDYCHGELITFIIFHYMNISAIIFIMSNMKSPKPERAISRLLETLGKPARIRILLAIGDGEACVCHLEAVLGLRQAYISQHLMVLREAGLLISQRDGRFVFYRLADQRLLDLIEDAAGISGVSSDDGALRSGRKMEPACCCPRCSAELIIINGE